MIKQNSLRILFSASLSVFLAACGGGGGGGSSAGGGSQPSSANQGNTTPSTNSTSTTSSTTKSASTTAVIDYYGDSTIWGYKSGVGGQVANPAPAVFAASLPQYRLTTQYTVVNEGVSRTTACQLLDGTDGKHPAWDTQMANSPAKIVIINFAINDEWQETLAQYTDCLTSLAQVAKSKGKTVIFETPNPTRDSGPRGLDTLVDAMKTVASQQGAPVIDQYAYLTKYLAGASIYNICPDGLHPTDSVYKMKGEYAASVFATLGLR